MNNRKIRNYLTVGYFGCLLIDGGIPLTAINSNLKAIRVVARYNQIYRAAKNREKAKTHSAEPIYNMLGSYTGFRWVKRA